MRHINSLGVSLVFMMMFLPVANGSGLDDLADGIKSAQSGSAFDAIMFFSKAIDSGDLYGNDLVATYLLRATNWAEMGITDNAVQDLRMVLELDPENQMAIQTLNDIFFPKAIESGDLSDKNVETQDLGELSANRPRLEGLALSCVASCLFTKDNFNNKARSFNIPEEFPDSYYQKVNEAETFYEHDKLLYIRRRKGTEHFDIIMGDRINDNMFAMLTDQNGEMLAAWYWEKGKGKYHYALDDTGIIESFNRQVNYWQDQDWSYGTNRIQDDDQEITGLMTRAFKEIAESPTGQKILVTIVGENPASIENFKRVGVQFQKDPNGNARDMTSIGKRTDGTVVIKIRSDVFKTLRMNAAAAISGDLANVNLLKKWKQRSKVLEHYNKVIHRAQVYKELGGAGYANFMDSLLSRQLSFELKLWNSNFIRDIDVGEYYGGKNNNFLDKKLDDMNAMGVAHDRFDTLLLLALDFWGSEADVVKDDPIKESQKRVLDASLRSKF
jgi:hypothetical protein